MRPCVIVSEYVAHSLTHPPTHPLARSLAHEAANRPRPSPLVDGSASQLNTALTVKPVDTFENQSVNTMIIMNKKKTTQPTGMENAWSISSTCFLFARNQQAHHTRSSSVSTHPRPSPPSTLPLFPFPHSPRLSLTAPTSNPTPTLYI